ncbi:hypothetical protein UFOVP703_18 [uncultured Caudovirales phage]|uniref:Uncharacterized protein n=1 Tax=uncultured Caudovirales phage TaxID=2100421 RepID=A0A6J5NNJ7_9CAUD|nr:hypothetical protein UFOVP703_18 [uncultured Caudovirales phage]
MAPRRLLKTDGTATPINRVTISEAARLMGADTLDTVNLRDGRVLLVNDAGHERQLPVNQAATALYHTVCRAGTTWQIRGDAIVTLDADFGGDHP